MRSPVTRFASLAFAACLFQSMAIAAPLTPGNLVVLQIGDGNTSVAGASVPVVLNELTTGGAIVQSIPVPNSVAGNRLTVTGSSGSSGHLSLSANNQYILLGGFDLAPGTLGASGTTTASRVVGRLDMSGNLDLTTYVGLHSSPSTYGFSGGDCRSVVGQDGAAYWAAGNSTGGGIRYMPHGNPATTTSTLVSGTPSNDRVALIYNGQLYMSSASSPYVGISRIGTGLPTTTGTSATLIISPPVGASGPSPYGFAFLSNNMCVVADDRAINGSLGGGLLGYLIDTGCGCFLYSANFTTGLTSGLRGVALGNYNGTGAVFVTDVAGALHRISTSAFASGFSPVATPPANTLYRGVVQVPSGTPVVAAADSAWSQLP